VQTLGLDAGLQFDLAASGQRQASGWIAPGDGLLALDRNQDGVIDARDSDFAALRVWVDANSDARSEAGELHSLGQLQISSLSLAAQLSAATDQGNLILATSSYTRSDGSSAMLADVWFQQAAPTGLRAQVGQLAQALRQFTCDGAVAADVLRGLQSAALRPDQPLSQAAHSGAMLAVAPGLDAPAPAANVTLLAFTRR